MRRILLALVAAVLAGLAPGVLGGQVAVLPLQNLSFGTLRAGVGTVVDPSDPTRRAEIELVGAGEVVITFHLPRALLNSGGRELPLHFGRGDAVLELKGSGRRFPFDPTKPRNIRIRRPEGGARVYLGGTARPDPAQPPGEYRATIVLQIVAPGT